MSHGLHSSKEMQGSSSPASLKLGVAATVAAVADRNRPHAADRPPRAARRRRRLQRLVCGGLAAVAALAVTAPAMADPFGLDTPTNNVNGVGAIPDNFGHTYCFDGAGWTTAWRNVVDSRMANLDAETSYWDSFLGSTCWGGNDVWFQLADLGPSLRGDYRCRWWNNGVDGIPNSGDDRCESAIIRLNSNSNVLTDDHQRRKTACHEIGHSVGLAHRLWGPPDPRPDYWNDCMETGRVDPGAQWERYNPHHEAHANSRTRSTS
jgi:hypothetical protein